MKKTLVTLDWIVENHIPFFLKLGMSEENIRGHYEHWQIDKLNPSANDYYWHLLQNIINEISKQVSDPEQLFELNYETYLKMWHFIVSVEHKNGNRIKKLMLENQLKLWQAQASKFKKQVVLISSNCCEYCESLNQKKLSFEEAIEKQYLASSKCTREWGCVCTYTVLSCRDENGRLIRI